MSSTPQKERPPKTSNPGHPGIEELLSQPLLEVLWQRRTHRVSHGVPKVAAGSMPM